MTFFRTYKIKDSILRNILLVKFAIIVGFVIILCTN